jgi:multiple sugar transport system permease protein
MKKQPKSKLKKLTPGEMLIYLFLLVIAIITVYPILYVVFGSFKENQELVLGGTKLLPEKFILTNYIQAWNIGNFARYTWNSVFLSVTVMILTLIITSMAGYCYARKDFPMKNLLYNLMIMFMFINVGSISLRPLFELAVKLNLNRSLWGVIFIAIGGGQATYIFLVRGFMNTIPKELDEAARIDGCGFFETYWRIILPVLKPALASVALLSFRGAWNEYILPLVFTMSNAKLRPLTVGVVALKNTGDGAAAWNIMFAGSAISIVPIIIVYLLASKQFMSGLTSGSVKG